MAKSGALAKISGNPTLILTMIAIVTLITMLNMGNAYAQTLILTPNQVTPGINVQVTGNGFQPSENAEIQVFVSSAGACAVMPVMSINVNTDDNGNLIPVTIPTSELSAGTYCVEGNGFLDAPETVDLIVNPGTTTTTAPTTTTPGYVYGLAVVGVFVALVFAVKFRSSETQG
jgi:hypothetical protein